MHQTNRFDWVPFYEELADKLLLYKDDRNKLFELIKETSKTNSSIKHYLELENKDIWEGNKNQIDPFNVFSALNYKNFGSEERISVAKDYANIFKTKNSLSNKYFNGIPTMEKRHYKFEGIDELWELFIEAMNVAKTNGFTNRFIDCVEESKKIHGLGLPTLTKFLFWIRPNVFISLDAPMRDYLYYKFNLATSDFSAKKYIELIPILKSEIDKKYPGLTFVEISSDAFDFLNSKEKEFTDSETVTSSDLSIEDPIIDNNKFPKNLILFGSPGTGKTYSSIQYAVTIIENKQVEEVKFENYEEVFSRYQKYKEDGLIAFTTFHQSYGYEEFVEGIRPVISVEDDSDYSGEIEYEIHDGIFKAFCDRAGTPVGEEINIDLRIGKNPAVWKVSLEGTGDNETRAECFANGHIRIGYDEYDEKLPETFEKGERGRNILNAFYYRMQIGDIVMSCYSNRTIDAIGVITGDPEWHDEYSQYRRLRKVKWLVTDINEDIYELNSEKLMMQPTVYKMSISVSDILPLLKKLKPSLFAKGLKFPNRVFIIDEINRGNISKVFGELITLIEDTKRIGAKEELRVTLPYSKQKFGVPDNVYIIGTMNTADRSIAIIDVALRRRFKFIEMLPDSSILEDIVVDGIDMAKMLDILNKRITILLDRDHTLGHSYFLKLKDNPSIEYLADIFQYEIIPQLQEYFYDDYEKIRLVLGDNAKIDESAQFIVKKADSKEQFADVGGGFDFSPEYYEINAEAFKKVEAYEHLK